MRGVKNNHRSRGLASEMCCRYGRVKDLGHGVTRTFLLTYCKNELTAAVKT